METNAAETHFAPAEKTDPEIFEKQAARFSQMTILDTLVSALPMVLMVLNTERQIVYANARLFELLGLVDSEEVLGKRPGEILSCTHATQSAGGCGTTEFCRKCGAVNAILNAHGGSASVLECRILTSEKEALDLRVWATPYIDKGEMFTLLGLLDISDEKRRQYLERIFFHDVTNTAGSLSMISDFLQDEDDPEEITEMVGMLSLTSNQLIQEIRSQQVLNSAENGTLELKFAKRNTLVLLKEIVQIYSGHKVANARSIQIAPDAHDSSVNSDPVLVRRVIGNMIKNALEATAPGGEVSVSCIKDNGSVIFSVHNSSVMSRDLQLQVFKRSFSTKGGGRGLGTFSMKLLGEKYLGGSVWFESFKGHGTTFFFSLPM